MVCRDCRGKNGEQLSSVSEFTAEERLGFPVALIIIINLLLSLFLFLSTANHCINISGLEISTNYDI